MNWKISLWAPRLWCPLGVLWAVMDAHAGRPYWAVVQAFVAGAMFLACVVDYVEMHP